MSEKNQTILYEKLSEDGDCALPHALSMMGEKWAFMILRASFNGVKHFEGFLNEIGLARNILANRLSRLTQDGILIRTPCPNDRRKVEYLLTDKGLDLLPVMIGLRQWGEKWATGITSSPILVDERDQQPIKPVAIYSHDSRILTWEDLCWIDAKDAHSQNDSDNSEKHSQMIRKLGSASI